LIYGEKYLEEVQASTAEYSDVFEECSSALTTKLPSEIEFRKRSIVNDTGMESSSIIVGLLKAEQTHVSQDIYEMFNNFKVKTVLIDYNKLINLEKINEESLHFAKQDIRLAQKLTLNRIKIEVEKFIKEQNINRIFIPDNLPLPSTAYYQLVTEAIVKIVDDNPSIHLLGICSGLQGIMNAQGVEIVYFFDDEKQHKSYLNNPQQENTTLQQIKIVPNSRLAEIVSKFLMPDENGWFSTYFPDTHAEAINNSLKNRKKLESLGYKVVGFSNDGMIKAIEDRHGNIHFQSHPEALVLKSDKNFYLKKQQELKKSILVAISIVHDFLYRNNCHHIEF